MIVDIEGGGIQASFDKIQKVHDVKQDELVKLYRDKDGDDKVAEFSKELIDDYWVKPEVDGV